MIVMVVLAVWFMIFGMWPIADPGHDMEQFSDLMALDVFIHVLGFVLFLRCLIGFDINLPLIFRAYWDARKPHK